jgi:hypothetical protein
VTFNQVLGDGRIASEGSGVLVPSLQFDDKAEAAVLVDKAEARMPHNNDEEWTAL